MDLRYPAADEIFRAEVRAWLQQAVPGLPPRPDVQDFAARRTYDTTWQRMVYEAGYAGIHWSREDGGRGGTPTQQFIYLEESERAGAPRPAVNFVGLLHAGPTIAALGTPEQRRAHLPKILRGEEIWCQGFSEPGAGSDLAGVRTRAVRDGDEYVVNGQKIWTTFGQVADFCEMLVRTNPDAPKHRGISWLMMPMNTPGIEVRPLRTVGGSSEFSEVFLDDVRIPVQNRIGAEDDGWRVAMVTLSYERGTAFVSDMLRSHRLLASLFRLAHEIKHGDGTAWDDDGIRRELGSLRADADGLWALTRWNVDEAERTGLAPRAGSVFKLAYSEWRHRLGDLAMHMLGDAAFTVDNEDLPVTEHVHGWYQALSLSIAAGTSQIQRNIIGERLLGLEKEPK